MEDKSTEKTRLTEIQSNVLQFIQNRHREHGIPPSYREMQAHFGYKAVGTVQDHVRALIRKGYLQRIGASHRARGLVSTRQVVPPGAKRIPVYGEVAAGPITESTQLELGQAVVASDLAANPSYALRVKGNSMIDIGIYEGDIVIVDKEARVKSGDIIVALVNGETTIKRYQRNGKRVQLIAENRRMKPIELASKDLQIQGRVVALQRRVGRK